MAARNQDDFDGYRKWLGISDKKRPPTHYELLGISLDEDDADVIQAAVEQRRHYVETKRGDGHDSVVTEILYRISEAESTLLNDEMRRDYDRQQDLFEKRRKSRQVDPYAPRSRVKSQPRRTAGEDTGLVRTYGKIMAILCVSFSVMAWFSFQLPWKKKLDRPIAAAPIERVQPEIVADEADDPAGRPAPPAARLVAPKPEPASSNENKTQVTFLVTLPRIDIQVHQNDWWWSDKGILVLGPKEGAVVRKPLMYDGKHSEHSIYMAARNSDSVWMTYRLNGRFETFESTVHVPEMLAEQGNPRAPLVFSAVGDGKTLWQSTALTQKGESQPCNISVAGVDELSLKIECRGPDYWALSAWIEPQVSGVGSGVQRSAVTANVQPSKMSPAAGTDRPGSQAVEVLEIRHEDSDGSRTDYAHVDGERFELGMGKDSDFGIAAVGWRVKHVEKISCDANFSGKPRQLDSNTFVGLILDYRVDGRFTKRVALTPMESPPKRKRVCPTWGANKLPDVTERIPSEKYLGDSSKGYWSGQIRKWAPPGWDNEVWVSVLLQNTGRNTSANGTVRFDPAGAEGTSAEQPKASPPGDR